MNNRIYEEFNNIHCRNEIKNSTKEFLAKKAYSKKPKHRYYRLAVPVVCCLIAVFGALSFGFVYSIPVAAVSVDINPSVQLSLNCFDRVVAATGYDDISRQILEKVDVNNRKYDEAVTSLISSEAFEDYSSSEDFVNITISAENNEKYEAIEESLNSVLSECNKNGKCNYADTDDAQKAQDAQISLGKYRAYLSLLEKDPDITIDDVRNMTMKEIRQLLGEESIQGKNSENMGSQKGNNSDDCTKNGAADSTECSSSVGKYGNNLNSENGSHGKGKQR
ncbi:MAG: hypothetical protein ACI4W1_08060 [Ruminococcus sp.]